MSPHVGNFVQDLVEMAKATERLPGLEAELAKAHDDIESYAKQVQALEMQAIDRKNEMENLREANRALEVSRDDAELRFLELDEKAGKVVALLGLISDHATTAALSLDPPKPQPEPVKAEPEHVAIHSWDEPVNVDQAHSDFGPIEASVGQSEASPTTANVVSQSSESAASTVTEAVAGTTSNGPYFGLRYYDHPEFVSYDRWIEGGGTQEDYNWRPSRSLA